MWGLRVAVWDSGRKVHYNSTIPVDPIKRYKP